MKKVIQALLAQKNIKAESIELTQNGIEINFSAESEQIARSIDCHSISGHIVFKRFSEVSQFVGESAAGSKSVLSLWAMQYQWDPELAL